MSSLVLQKIALVLIVGKLNHPNDIHVPNMVGFLRSTLIKTILFFIIIIHVSPTCWWSLIIICLSMHLSVLMKDMSKHLSLQGEWTFSKRSLFSFQYVEGIKKFMIIIIVAYFISISLYAIFLCKHHCHNINSVTVCFIFSGHWFLSLIYNLPTLTSRRRKDDGCAV